MRTDMYGLVLTWLVAQSVAVTTAYVYRMPAVRTPFSYPDTQQHQQYYTQDIYGQYAYGYSGPEGSKQEQRALDGTTRGTYSYVDAKGSVQKVRYIADADGFRVVATNLPVFNLTPVTETPEVAAARAQHLAAHRVQRLHTDLAPHMNLPQSVQDTPEVAAAKVEFFQRFEEEKLRHKLLRERNMALQTSIVAPPNDFTYNIIVPERRYLPAVI